MNKQIKNVYEQENYIFTNQAMRINQTSLNTIKERNLNLKSLPQRTCIGCNTKKNKNELIRIVRSKEGNISIDRTGKADGRGAYICDSEECLKKAIKSKRLDRIFETKISDEIYENLRGVIIDK